MRFNHLNVPQHWETYWTKYPEGYTILEALVNWLGQVDSMVDNQNTLNTNVETFQKDLSDFLSSFDPKLQSTVEDVLEEWQQSGFLNDVINTSVQTQVTALDAKITGLPKEDIPSNTIVLLGDSLTNQNNVANSFSDRGFFVWGNAFLGQAFKLLKNAGVGGQRVDQFNARLDADVFAYNPAWVMVLGGTNDLVQGYDADTIYTNLKTVWSAILAKGIRLIVSTVPPATVFTTNAQKTALFKLNRLIKEHVKSNPRLILVDMGAAYIQSNSTDPVNGAVHSDGIHPGAFGACKMGEIFATEMKKHVKTGLSTLSYSNKNPENLLSNGTQYGTSGQLAGNPLTTGLVADSWLSVPSLVTVVASKEKRTDVQDGEWQVLTCSNGDTVNGLLSYYSETTTGFIPGDKVVASLEMEVDPASVITQKIDVVVECRDANNAIVGTPLSPLIHESAYPNLGYAPRGVFIVQSPEFNLPANTAKIRLMARAYIVSGKVKVGRAEIRKA